MLSRFVVDNFRNISSADVLLSPGLNVFLGPNGSGKTNFMEAIYTLGHARAFRTHQVERVIRHQHQQFVLHARIRSGGQERIIGISKKRSGENHIRIDGKDSYKAIALAQLLPIQLITPEGFSLLTGGPKHRRAFIDWGCFHSDPIFGNIWSQLKRAMKQRNAALHQVRSYSQLRHWDRPLILLAEEISAKRSMYTNAITKNIQDVCHQFLPEFSLNFSLQRGWDKEYNYSALLEHSFERDKSLNYTTQGPHKADFRIRVHGTMVEDLLSRGELKLLMCALRLAQGEYLSHHCGRQCLYIIDDFAAELDEKHRKLLAKKLKSIGAQIFVSVLREEDISDILDGEGKMFLINHGNITEIKSSAT